MLDLFCGAGGAAMGYHRAGFDVVGVDIKPQPNYPFKFIQADAAEWLKWNLGRRAYRFDAIHASPPCQAHTALKTMWNAKQHEDLVGPTRELLMATGLPWVMENVPGAPMPSALMLCGTMFRLGTADGTAELRRHRWFEVSPDFLLAPPCEHGWSAGRTVGVYGDGNGIDYRRQDNARTIGVYGGHGRDRRRKTAVQGFSVRERQQAMDINWMTGDELSQAIPPAYTEWIGREIIARLEVAA